MELEYLQFGKKEPKIIFLHGWQQRKQSLTPLVPFLYKNHRLYFLGLPGFGKVKMPSTITGSKEYAELVARWLKKKKLLPAILVGHSFGGKIATLIALNHPKLISHLILIASSGIPQPKWWYPIKDIVPQKIRKSLFPIFGSLLTSQDCQTAGPLLPFLKNIVKEDLRPQFKKIKIPTLIIWGKNDQELPIKHGKTIHRSIPKSQLKILPGDHFPFQKNPQKMANLILKFIKNERN